MSTALSDARGRPLGAVLVFPAVNKAAEDFVQAALERGDEVLCAASVPVSGICTELVECFSLPEIYSEAFFSELGKLVEAKSIGRIFCPVSVVHRFVADAVAQQQIDLKLIGQSPIKAEMIRHHLLIEEAQRLKSFVDCVDRHADRRVSLLEIAGVIRHSDAIYGESNHDKLAAMMAVMASAPRGDVVEIGSLMGRSAFVLMFAARRFRIGPLLTVDPWAQSECVQHDSPSGVQDLTDEWDYEVVAEGFRLNLAAAAPFDHAHLRHPSNEAFAIYAGGAETPSELGDPVAFTREIACIHIDGNHDYASVQEDCALWLRHLLPGAWLILDDYVWAHGDGPQRIGDELLREHRHRIDRAFVCGKALFVRFTSQL